MALAAAAVVALAAPASAQAAVVGSHPVPGYQTNGRVNAILFFNGNIYIGGKFTSVRPAGAPAGTGEVTRDHVAAFDATTGALLNWNPNASATVSALAGAGSTVYIGGSFAKLGNATRSRLGAVDATSGAVLAAFKPKLDAAVTSLAVGGGTVYAGGTFTTANGAARSSLAAFDAANGTLSTTWAPAAGNDSGTTPMVTSVRLSPTGTTVYVGGGFTTIDGSSQSHVAALSASTGQPLGSFTHHVPYAVVDMAVDSTGVFLAGAGNGGNFASLNPATGSIQWQGGTDGNVQAIALLDGEVYVGGHYTNYCGPQGGQHTCTNPVVRLKLLAVDESTGALTPWNPHANSNLGVFALAGSGTMLAAGGDFTKIGGADQQGFAQFTE
ncbi:MAG: outer membrane protein assembly factor BamB family protein [Gaiellales bacterium]